MAVLLADGAWHAFKEKLDSCQPSARARVLLQTLGQRNARDAKYAHMLLNDLQEVKVSMHLRVQQAFSFWDSLPFSALRMARHLIFPGVSEEDSRQVAAAFLKEHDQSSSRAALGGVSWLFFGHPENRRLLEAWVRGGQLAYSTTLLVMQPLESRHRLVHQAIGCGPGTLPGAMVAALRRMMNGDLEHPAFRSLLPALLSNFGDLLPPATEWNSKRELLEKVYGYGVEQLHPDVTFEERQLAQMALADEPSQGQPLDAMQSEHLHAVLKRGRVYALPDFEPAHCLQSDLVKAKRKNVSTAGMSLSQ